MRHSQADGRDEVKSCRRYSVPGRCQHYVFEKRKLAHPSPTTGAGGMNGRHLTQVASHIASDEPAFVVAFL